MTSPSEMSLMSFTLPYHCVISFRTSATKDFYLSLSCVALMNYPCNISSVTTFTYPPMYFSVGLPRLIIPSTILVPVIIKFSIPSLLIICLKTSAVLLSPPSIFSSLLSSSKLLHSFFLMIRLLCLQPYATKWSYSFLLNSSNVVQI